jgi:phage gpG-like protein
VIPNNLKLVQGVWKQASAKVDLKARMARDDMMTALIQLTKETLNEQGKRPYEIGPRGGRIYTKAISGHPPMMRTGDLKRSIRGERFKTGFANYSAIVGPTISYGRVLELGGNPNWTSGTKFPYMAPTWAKFQGVVAAQIVARYFGKGI